MIWISKRKIDSKIEIIYSNYLIMHNPNLNWSDFSQTNLLNIIKSYFTNNKSLKTINKINNFVEIIQYIVK